MIGNPASSLKMEPIERTEEMIAMALASLPDPPDATIWYHHHGGVPGGGAGEDSEKPARKQKGSGGAEKEGGEDAGRRKQESGGAGWATGSGGDGGLTDSGGDGSHKGGQVRAARTLDGNIFNNQDKYDQYMNLFIYSGPVSSVWEPIWETKPLILHDMHLVDASEFVARRGEPTVECRVEDKYSTPDSTGMAKQTTDSTQEMDSEAAPRVNLTNEITDILRRHPGPVECFRIDTSIWTDSGTSVKWIQMLSDKWIQEHW